MTIENEQITPADAAIVSSGTGTKGPEERDLPASLKEEMDLCLQILREVLDTFRALGSIQKLSLIHI